MATPNFYKIDVEREVVLQGKSSTFVTITRDDTVMASGEYLYIIGFPQAYTFEERAEILTNANPAFASAAQQPVFFQDFSPANSNTPAFNRITEDLVVRNWWDLDPGITVADAPVSITGYTPGNITVQAQSGYVWPSAVPAGTTLKLGKFSTDESNSFFVNAAPINDLTNVLYNSGPGVTYSFETLFPNAFDGTTWAGNYGQETGHITRQSVYWIRVESKPTTNIDGNEETNGVTFRIDYDGVTDAHLKFNFIIFKSNQVVPNSNDPFSIPGVVGNTTAPFGLKSGDGSGNYTSDADYQEIHFFGYPEDYVRPARDNSSVEYPILKPLYDDRSSYGLLKTNPKLSGNVKVTVDSLGDIWMNSFDANEELSDASYKKFSISPASTYQKDLYSFFKNGQTPSDVVFDLYEYDDQYLNSKQSYSQQFDNFYNYGVEQLNSKFYDEKFSFLAPIWLRKNLPDFFIILRVDHPISVDSYLNASAEQTISDYMGDARIIKTFDLRSSSKLGSYIRNLVNDPRWRERPLEFSWDSNTPTYWSGAVYTSGTLSSSGELIYDFIKADKPIKEFEEFITGGFQRNSTISTNLINLEFLFNDEEAPLYSINRYIGLYVTENQLAEFEIEPTVLGDISGQTPLPKPGVDGQPYSIKSFVQTNSNGIQIPVHYYHNTPFVNNTSIVPTYQGLVIGKFPLPAMVDDPLRLFYVKDRDDVFKKVRKLTEVNYGSPTSPDFIRATQLELFDTQEDISKYGGVTDIVSQFPATLLDSGYSQMRLHLLDQYGTGCIADNEELIFEIKKYNDSGSINKYHAQVTDFVTATSLTVEYFFDQDIVFNSTSFDQPPPGKNTSLVTYSPAKDLSVGETVYIVSGGYYSVVSAPSNTTAILQNLGGGLNATPTTFTPAVSPNGTLYTTANNVPTTGGLGTGLTVNIQAVSGVVYNIEIESAGDGYQVGDIITINQIGSGLNATFTITSVSNIGVGAMIGSSLNGVATYNANPLDTYLAIDNYLKLDLVDFVAGYSVYDAWQIDLNIPSIQKFILNGSNNIDAQYTPQYQQFRWRMIANGTGLQPGDAWDYPLLDPNGVDYVSTFSNEGRLDQIAKAISKCVNSFEGLPVQAFADESEIYFKSTLKYEEGNDILFKRVLQGNSYYANIGFYETGNVNRGNDLSAISLQITPTQTTNTYNIDAEVLQEPDQITNTGYLVQVTRSETVTNILIRVGANISTWALANTTGVPFIFNIPTKDEFFVNTNIPITFNLKKIPINTAGSWVFEQTSNSTVEQNFVGGQRRLRNRARIEASNGKNYYQDRKVIRLGNTTASSTTVSIDTTGVYVGAPISGPGIPSGAKVIDVNVNSLVMNLPATVSQTSVKISIGELSILNDSQLYQQWYQSQKSVFSRMKGWDVQGKYVYSLPYLDQPTYDVENYLTGFTSYKDYAIIQLDKNDQEFYYSNDKRVVAYSVYRPTFGVFSLFPIKEFDFDFLFSEYSYTPTLELFKYFFNEEATNGRYIELELFENFRISQIDAAGNPSNSAYDLFVEALDVETAEWTNVDKISVQPFFANSEFLFNTFYPLYDYDMYRPTVSAITASGTAYTTANNIPTTGGSGTGMIVNITAVAGSVTNVDILAPGAGYTTGDVITIFAGNLDATFTLIAGLPDGYPYLAPDPTNASSITPTQSRGAGFRNFDRRYLVKRDLTTNDSIVFQPAKFRIRYEQVFPSTAEKIVVTNYNFEKDEDLKLFNGFAGVQDITGLQDSQVIENLKQNGQYIEALTYQLLLSEYDRLRENFSKDWAVKSKTVPYINKWVQEGTDARDNYYRLNTSMSLGLSNLSPSSAVDFAEPAVLTHEFPYLDAIPQDYPTESLETSRSYFFGKLSDVAYRGKTWYDLITADNTNDWFFKYFSLGYPTEKFFGGEKIPKSRDERYTFFLYNNGVGKSQSLFRGAKIEITQYEAGPNVVTPLSIPIENSTAFSEYKFSAIARFLPYEEYTKEKPVDIEIIKNDKFKTIVMIFTIKVKDYRTQSGHIDYALQYFSNDILKNTNQTQLAINRANTAANSLQLRNFLPYDNTYSSYLPATQYTPESVMRPRQGFLGGGYLQLGDKKIGGVINYAIGASPVWTAPSPPNQLTKAQLFMQFLSADPVTYDFSLLDEITTINNSYRVYPGTTSYPFMYDSSLVPVIAKEFGDDGYEFNIHTAIVQPTLSGGNFTFWNYTDMQERVDILTLDSITLGSASNFSRFRTFRVPGGVLLQSAISSPSSTSIPGAVPATAEIRETYFVNGGTDGFQSIKNSITFGNIQSLVNVNSPLIEYYNVTDAGKVVANDFRIRMIDPDSLVKTNVLNYSVDEDKPAEYQSSSVIGYNIVDTNGQEYITRHRGYYEPKTRDILTFWLREDAVFSSHFELDFLLSNTHINAKSALSGLVRNYGINKVATSGDVMAISTGSSYKSLYPLVGEVSVTNKNFNAFTSSWDSNFYRNYQTTTNFTEVYGIAEMKETKAFLASKAMNVPNSFDLHDYEEGIEYTFELIQPAASIGVDPLASNSEGVQQGVQYANKPKLIITIDIEEKLRRELLSGILATGNVDEFSRLTTLGIAELNALTPVDIQNLKTDYLNKNIINIYQVSDVLLYSLQLQGVELVIGDLTEVEKVRANYKVDKDCVVTQLSAFKFQITKILNPAIPVSFTFSANVKRI
jgi:hypothetical protein